jgi:hypothetical protein
MEIMPHSRKTRKSRQRNWRIAQMAVAAIAAAKMAANSKSFTAKARPQPKAARIERAMTPVGRGGPRCFHIAGKGMPFGIQGP